MAADRSTNEEIVALFKQEPFKTILKKRLQERLDIVIKDAEKHIVTGKIDEAVRDVLTFVSIKTVQEKLWQ